MQNVTEINLSRYRFNSTAWVIALKGLEKNKNLERLNLRKNILSSYVMDQLYNSIYNHPNIYEIQLHDDDMYRYDPKVDANHAVFIDDDGIPLVHRDEWIKIYDNILSRNRNQDMINI
jgi:hypothetical protein